MSTTQVIEIISPISAPIVFEKAKTYQKTQLLKYSYRKPCPYHLGYFRLGWSLMPSAIRDPKFLGLSTGTYFTVEMALTGFYLTQNYCIIEIPDHI